MGKSGIERVIQPELNEEEREAFREAARRVSGVIDAIG